MRALQEFAIYCPNTPTLRGINPDQQSRLPVGLNGGQLAEAFELLRKHLESQGDEGDAILDEVLDLIDWVADVTITSQAGSLLAQYA